MSRRQFSALWQTLRRMDAARLPRIVVYFHPAARFRGVCIAAMLGWDAEDGA